MKDNFIQLSESDTLKLKIKDVNGNYTGEMLEFDLEDIDLLLRYQDMIEKDKKNLEWLRNQTLIIDRKQDVKGKKLLSKNEEDKLKALKEYFNREIECFNMFLGENGVQKLLNGRRIGWNTLEEINVIIKEQIAPKLDVKMESISDKIKKKYSNKINDSEVLK
ncbi:MAG: hypothetical protein VZR33_05625 [Methanosphaera sp.]|nr:hypothetical protein [Methanosphaera sp.]